jgi:hypothetical protein
VCVDINKNVFMKIAAMLSNHISKLPLAGLILILAACDGDKVSEPNLHDTKYVGIGAAGEQLDSAAGTGSCALDQYTGLMWEVKTDTPGLHDWRNTYSWYNPEENFDKGLDYRGTASGGECAGSDCDTWAFVHAVNAVTYCGYSDWRIPSRNALASISDLRKLAEPPTTNMQYFPYSQPAEYWSGNDYDFQWDTAWTWNFEFGHDRVDWKRIPKHVRLVRGEAGGLARVPD